MTREDAQRDRTRDGSGKGDLSRRYINQAGRGRGGGPTLRAFLSVFPSSLSPPAVSFFLVELQVARARVARTQLRCVRAAARANTRKQRARHAAPLLHRLTALPPCSRVSPRPQPALSAPPPSVASLSCSPASTASPAVPFPPSSLLPASSTRWPSHVVGTHCMRRFHCQCQSQCPIDPVSGRRLRYTRTGVSVRVPSVLALSIGRPRPPVPCTSAPLPSLSTHPAAWRLEHDAVAVMEPSRTVCRALTVSHACVRSVCLSYLRFIAHSKSPRVGLDIHASRDSFVGTPIILVDSRHTLHQLRQLAYGTIRYVHCHSATEGTNCSFS